MGRIVSVLLAVLLQLGLVLTGHIYYTKNPKNVAIVVESSYGLTQFQNKIVDAVDVIDTDSKYTVFHYGTDKHYEGPDAEIGKLFKIGFGKINVKALDKLYPKKDYNKRYLLTFTDAKAGGWEIINIENK